MKYVLIKSLNWVVPAILSGLALVGCGGGTSDFASPSFMLGGTVGGLDSGNSVQLTVSGTANSVRVGQNGAFQLPNKLSLNGSFAVIVSQQPTGQTCTVSNSTGAGVVADVSNVSVLCSDNTYPVSGTVTGLSAGDNLVIQNNSANSTTVTGSAFAFTTPVVYNSSYAVTVSTQPTGKTCTVNNGTGAGVVANITNVNIVCTVNTYTISGTVSGLASNQQVTLNNNSANPTTVTANGSFSFSTPVTYNGSYAVVVGTQPIGQTCTVNNSTGAGVVANIANVAVICTDITYTISGTVSGLASGNQVTLNNNSANPTTLTTNGGFSFSTPVTYNGSYAVTVGTQPTGQTCTVNSAAGAGITANISNITISCTNRTYTVSGTVSGLSSGFAGNQVTLFNNSSDPITVAANGTFTFSTPVAYRSNYAVTVGTQPNNDVCTVSNSSAAMGAGNVNNVAVICTPLGYALGGTVSGVAPNGQLTLVNNNNLRDAMTVGNGSFEFTMRIAVGATYQVSVNQQPTGQQCTLTGNSGTMGNAAVTSVNVVCEAVKSQISVNFMGSGTTTGVGGDVLEVYLSSNRSVVRSFGNLNLNTNRNGSTFPGTYPSGTYNLLVQTLNSNLVCDVTTGGGLSTSAYSFSSAASQVVIPITLVAGGQAPTIFPTCY